MRGHMQGERTPSVRPRTVREALLQPRADIRDMAAGVREARGTQSSASQTERTRDRPLSDASWQQLIERQLRGDCGQSRAAGGSRIRRCPSAACAPERRGPARGRARPFTARSAPEDGVERLRRSGEERFEVGAAWAASGPGALVTLTRRCRNGRSHARSAPLGQCRQAKPIKFRTQTDFRSVSIPHRPAHARERLAHTSENPLREVRMLLDDGRCQSRRANTERDARDSHGSDAAL